MPFLAIGRLCTLLLDFGLEVHHAIRALIKTQTFFTTAVATLASTATSFPRPADTDLHDEPMA
jgi:hypothetical protein